MMHEYKIAPGWKAFMMVACIGMMIGGVAWLIHLINDGFQKNIYLVILPVLLFAVGVWWLKMALEFVIIITDKHISVTENGKTKELLLSEIKGYSINDKYTILQPKDPAKPPISISSYAQNYETIQMWAQKHFTNLDQVEVEKEEEEILHNEQFGTTEKEREHNLQKAKKVASIFNRVGYGLMLWAFLYPYPYNLVCVLCLVFPFVAFIPYKHFGGLLKLNPQKNTAYGDISSLALVPLVLLLRALMDYEIMDYSNIWLPAAILTAVFTIGLAYKSPEFAWSSDSGKAVLFFTLFIAFGFAFGIVVFCNCYNDDSDTQIYYAQVLNKSSSGSRHTSYYLELSPWGNRKVAKDVTVDSDLYRRAYKGETVSVHVSQGRLNAPWYYVSD